MKRVKILFGIFLSYCLSASAESQSTLKVGVIVPLSGALEAYGKAAHNGFSLGAGEQASKNFTTLFEDDQYKAAQTVTALQKLIAANGIDLVITLGSSPSNAAAAIAEERHLPMLAWASDVRVAKGKPYVVRLNPSARLQGRIAGTHAAELGYNAIGVLTTTSDFPVTYREGLFSTFKREAIVVSDEVAPEIRDFRPFLLRARQAKAEQLGTCLLVGQNGLFAKQARDIGIKVPIFGCDTLNSHDDVNAADGALDGTWFVSTLAPNESFIEKYKKAFSNDDIIGTAATFYELAFLLSDISRSSKRGIDLIQEVLNWRKGESSLGPLRFIREDGDQYLDIQPGIVKIKGTSFERS